MPVRPRLGAGVPELTARVTRAGNPAGATAMRVRDRRGGLRAGEDFAGWYPRDGRPGDLAGPAGHGERAAVPARPF